MFERGGEEILAAHKAQDYFEMRGVPLADVATYAAANFCFHGRSEYWPEATYQEREDGRRVKVQAGRHFPAVHSAVRNETGEVVGCHVTFLDEVLPAKAPVSTPKLMFGAIAGGVAYTGGEIFRGGQDYEGASFTMRSSFFFQPSTRRR